MKYDADLMQHLSALSAPATPFALSGHAHKKAIVATRHVEKAEKTERTINW